MYDTAVAFTEWCNEHGGILGRELVLSDVDAKLFEYEPAVTEACGRDFALVGGGAVFDEDPNDVRVGCDLPEHRRLRGVGPRPHRRPAGAADPEPDLRHRHGPLQRG